MIFETSDGKKYDTQSDLTAEERHILQKLFLWQTLAKSLEEFTIKKQAALMAGWNNSGPVAESSAMKHILNDLEKRVIKRLFETVDSSE